jgi:MFS transporter, ACS family, hexuronate transporter
MGRIIRMTPTRITPSKFRWFIIFLLFAITVVNYIDRAAISYAIPLIERDLGLSPADTGAILGAFGLGYAITTLIGGFAVDRYGARLVLTVAALLWSLSIGATALASGFVILYAARVLLGVSEGPNFPALTGAVSHWLSPQERATALGNALLAVPLALAIGGPIVTQLLAWLDWRLSFAVLFGLSVLWVPLWYVLFRDSPADSRFVDKAELAHIRTSAAGPAPAPAVLKSWPGARVLKVLLTNRTLLANTWAFFVFGYFLFFFMTWLPSYLEHAYGLNLKTIGLFTVLPWLAAAILLWLMGRWSDHLLKTTGRLRVSRSYLIAGTQLIAALAIVPVALTHDLTVAIAGITVAVAASMGANASYYAVNVDIAPSRAATSLGIMDFAFAISGFLAPVMTGRVLDLRGSFTDGFLLMAALALSSVVVVLLFHRPDEDREDPAL